MEQVFSRNPRIPGEAIAIDENAVLTTHDEAVLLKNDIDAHPDTVKTVALVTDPWHARRARWIYQKVLGDDITFYMLPVQRTRTDFPKNWCTEASSRQLGLKEYVKLGFYLSATRLPPGIFARGCFSLKNSSKNY